MKLENGLDWLLTGSPRPAQVEALGRSYSGVAYRAHRDAPAAPRRLPHAGHPARGWGHWMEPRVGKTPTLLNEFMLLKRDYGVRWAIVFAPNKYKYTWVLETQHFGVDVDAYGLESTRRELAQKFIARNTEGLISVNYEAGIYQETLSILAKLIEDEGGNVLIAADESVLIKGHNSQRSKNIRDLAKGCKWRRSLTGKPVVQDVTDLYAQFRFIGAFEGMVPQAFKSKYALKGGYKGRAVVGVKNKDSLDRARDRFTFFARRKDWGTAIDGDYQQIELQMAKPQMEAYRQMEDEFMVFLEDSGDMIEANMVLTQRMKLQQISSGWVYDDDRRPVPLMPFEKTAKAIDLIERLENEIVGKAIVIFHYSATGDGLFDLLKRYNPAVIRSNVWMRQQQRDVDSEKSRFNKDPSCRVMLGQSTAIKYGHTLMGSEDDPCLATIYYENNYSLDDRAQTEERNQGEGQQAAINFVDYFSSPIEKHVITALAKKEDLVATIMGYYGKKTLGGGDALEDVFG